MDRELNTKDEMLKRSAYAVYIICLFFCFLFGLRGLAAERPEELLGALLLGCIAFCLRRIGVRYLEFRRLAQSFPMGGDADRLTAAERRTVEYLIREFHGATNWVERQAIRDRLEAMVVQKPVIVNVYGRKLMEVHPGCLDLAARLEGE